MTRFLIACVAAFALSALPAAGQMNVVQESFEDDGEGVRYTTSEICNDGSGDFFTRTDLSDVGTFYNISGIDGSFLYAAMDTDADPCTLTTETLTFNEWTLQNCDMDALTVAALFAEDDDGSAQDWDADSAVRLEANIDGGGFQNLICFAAVGATNTEPALDTDCDGAGDTPALTDTLAEFTGAIPGQPATLQLRVVIENLTAGDEDIAFDNIRLQTGTADIDCSVGNVPVDLQSFSID
ncbi:MAG: hypothetical protein AAGN46_08605 [Acidobacteriota bacterium]